MLDSYKIHHASGVEKMDAFQLEFFSLVILDTYAVDDVGCCDASDYAILNEYLEKNQLKIIHEIDPEKYWGYTHIVQTSEGFLYAVELESK